MEHGGSLRWNLEIQAQNGGNLEWKRRNRATIPKDDGAWWKFEAEIGSAGLKWWHFAVEMVKKGPQPQ